MADKKNKIILWAYSGFLLAHSIVVIFTELHHKPQEGAFQSVFLLMDLIFNSTGLFLYTTPIDLIIGYGLLRRRFWSRYGVIAVMLTYPILLLAQYIWWGGQSLQVSTVAIQVSFVILTLLYFSRETIKSLLGGAHRFRLKSWYSLLIIVVMIVSSLQLITALYFKIWFSLKYNAPLFEAKPQILELEKVNVFELSQKYQKVTLLDVDLLIPQGFALKGIRRDKEKPNEWQVALQDASPEKRGRISLDNHFLFGEANLEEIRKKARITTKFDFEKFILTNNWNPIFSTLNMIARPSGEEFKIREIKKHDLRGFLRSWQRNEGLHWEFSLHDPTDARFIGGSILFKKGYLDENDVLTILSSIEFLKPNEPKFAVTHYRKGLEFCNRGDIHQALIEFANTYYLSPDDPEYIFALAKALYIKEQRSNRHIEELLTTLLRIKPDHKGAQQLFRKIESNSSEEDTEAKRPK
jgi:hypothetical protein